MAIIKGRATARARALGVSLAFLWVNMNWSALVPLMRIALAPDGRCGSCGHAYVNERDVQIDHIESPRHDRDFAREHKRNLILICQSCNKTKGNKQYADWLDEMDAARIANDRQPDVVAVEDPHEEQLSLW